MLCRLIERAFKVTFLLRVDMAIVLTTISEGVATKPFCTGGEPLSSFVVAGAFNVGG